jgi:hypothetical protein
VLTLALLVPGIAADNIDAALAAHDLAVIANLFDACSYLHDSIPKNRLKQGSISLSPAHSQGPFKKFPTLPAKASVFGIKLAKHEFLSQFVAVLAEKRC